MQIKLAMLPDAPDSFEDALDAGAFAEPTLVHSSFGRMRVHLPHWSGAHSEAIRAELGQLPAVTAAEANSVTGNVLIFFDPEQASGTGLLQAIANLPEPSFDVLTTFCQIDAPVARSDQGLEPTQGEIVYMTGTGRLVYKTLGWSSVGMAVVGAIMPGIPTAPFVILAGYFFVRSSPEAHEWLRQSRWFGPILRDWEAHRGVRRSIRNAALALIGGGMVVTALLGLPTPLTVSIIACQVIGIAIVLRLRVVEPSLEGAAPSV
jgi:uncharacterized membrane protein YbaN (DUF454 family)